MIACASAKFQIRPSVRTTSAFFLVSLWNGAEGVVDAGSELDFKIYSNQSSVAPGGLRSCSCASRAVLRDNDNYDHNARAEVSVSIQGQQGFWYFYVRSPVAHRDGPPAGQATIYRFRPGGPFVRRLTRWGPLVLAIRCGMRQDRGRIPHLCMTFGWRTGSDGRLHVAPPCVRTRRAVPQ